MISLTNDNMNNPSRILLNNIITHEINFRQEANVPMTGMSAKLLSYLILSLQRRS
jgi:hypothetical protein